MRATAILSVRKFTRKLLPTPSTALARKASPSAPQQQQAQQPPPAPYAPPQQSLFDVVKEGMAFGVGSAIARNIVGSLWPGGGFGGGGGGGDAPPPHQPPPPPPEEDGGDDDDF